ncbi:transcriptional regulator GcvA [Marinomonas gallaica]|uniref:transcriptional regulator GcvA n=1 Tax=Marinomonas gallaica TaxID=1806667 RepID=UPI003A8FEB99
MAKKIKKRLPPLNWLHSFEASARHLNFTLAAQELNLTQAAVSQQVKGLESQLGSLLFKRLPRSLELTDAGKAYLPAVRESIDRISIVTEEVFGQRRRSQPLTVKVSLVFLNTWLTPRIERFRLKHPNVRLRFTSNIWLDSKEQTDSDLEIRYGQGRWPNVQSERLTWDHLIPVCSPKLVNGKAIPSSPGDLANYDLLHVIGYEEGWGYWLKQAGFQDVEIDEGIQFDTLISTLEMASYGLGIALGRSSLIQPMIETGKLIAPFKEAVPTNEAFYLISSEKSYLHPDASTFREWLLEEVDLPSND